MDWISVKDRLPDPPRSCLVVTRHRRLGWREPVPEVMEWRGDDWYLPDDSTYAEWEVTHWMPLPQPPQGVSDER